MLETEKRHTFVVCAYKESGYLEQCVQSLLKQTEKSQIVMATSTPNDLILRVAEKHQIPLRINNGASGIAQDWNFAYSQASTDYVTLAHQDDIYEATYTARMFARMETVLKPLIFFSNYYEIRNGDKVVSNNLLRIKRLLTAPLRIKSLQQLVVARRFCLAFGSSICCPSVTFAVNNLPKEVFTVHFRSDVDWQAWEQLSRLKGSFCYDSKMLVGHRIHGDSETTKVIGEGQRTKEDMEMFQKFWPRMIAKLLTGLYASSERSNKE